MTHIFPQQVRHLQEAPTSRDSKVPPGKTSSNTNHQIWISSEPQTCFRNRKKNPVKMWKWKTSQH